MNQEPIKVLLIEDDQDFAQVMRNRLDAVKNPSFTLTCADTLSAGIEHIQNGSTEIILLDLNLSDSKGLDTLTKLQKNAGNLPIIVLTGDYDESTGPETIRLGAQDYFLKGKIDASALTRAMRYAIERKRNQQELSRAYEELKETYIKLKEMYEVIPSILISLNPENIITHWNDVAKHAFGLTYEDIFEKKLSNCGIEWDHSALEEAAAKCRSTKLPVRLEKDISFKSPNGKEGLLGFSINQVKGRFQDGTDVLLYGANVTERRRIEERLKQFEGK